MDTELADRLAELKSGLSSIDAQCEAIRSSQDDLNETFKTHEERDREDFKEVHIRISAVEKKQNWILGVGTTGIFVLTMIGGFFKSIFGG